MERKYFVHKETILNDIFTELREGYRGVERNSLMLSMDENVYMRVCFELESKSKVPYTHMTLRNLFGVPITLNSQMKGWRLERERNG